MFIPRKIYSGLVAHLEKKPITLLTGMRRTGKTTLVKQLLEDCADKNKLYIDLERIDNRLLFGEKNYENILLALAGRGLDINSKMTIAIDELQLLPEITSVIKYLYDHYPIKFILTGSSSFYLKGLISDSLAGRKKIFELFPLDFGEFLTFKNMPHGQPGISKVFIESEYHRLKGFYDEFILYGGFPEVVLASDSTDKTDYLADIISSYINIDVKSLSDFRNISMVQNLIKMLALRCSYKLDISKISSLTGISRPTVQSYIELFEKTYLIHLLPVYSQNTDREIVKMKKIYFCDTGLLNVFANPGSGITFENALFLQLRQHSDLKYYSLKTGNEIDFIADKEAYEVKETPAYYDLENLKKTSSRLTLRNHYVVGRFPPAKHFNEFIWGGNIV
ncbi:MAG TPA: ATP-binding protein [Bacteroidales bacterium]|nr:ATP-binding protein [Bacteroidales bacterium]HPM91256.1 ATP-binding protein [Bacteroidales bacterium]